MKQSKTPIISFSPVVIPVAGRHVDLEMKFLLQRAETTYRLFYFPMGMARPTFFLRIEDMAPW